MHAGAADLRQERIAQLYRQGLAGDATAVEECIAALEQTLKNDPQNQLARVYLGSAYTLRSRDLAIGPSKLRAFRQGIETMETATKLAPEDARVKFVRAITLHALPGFLGQRRTAREELFALAETARDRPGQLPPEDRQLVYLNAGHAARGAGQTERALRYWKLGLAIPGRTQVAEKLKEALQKHGG